MELLFILAIFAAFALASAVGWTADTHDSADWKPSVGGFRQPRTY
jgi:hypothetical protein